MIGAYLAGFTKPNNSTNYNVLSHGETKREGTRGSGGSEQVLNWTVPSDVTEIAVICIGGGSPGSIASGDTAGGGGGGCSYVNKVSVTPGETLSLRAGRGGWLYYAGGAAGSSYLKRGSTTLCWAEGGGRGYAQGDYRSRQGGRGGTTLGYDGGGDGGEGGETSNVAAPANCNSSQNAAGGAGGLSGNGGQGGRGSKSTDICYYTGDSGSSGRSNRGGGGGGNTGNVTKVPGGGGGTGTYGENPSGYNISGIVGQAGQQGGTNGNYGLGTAGPGGLGYGTDAKHAGNGAVTTFNNSGALSNTTFRNTIQEGGDYGGGGAQDLGGRGIVKVIWGKGRAWPETSVEPSTWSYDDHTY